MWGGAKRQFSLSVYKHVVSTLTYTGRGLFLLCDFSWGDIKKYLSTADWGTSEDPREISIHVQLNKPMSLLGLVVQGTHKPLY